MKLELKAKPISVNQVWQGRRFKTKLYKDYEIEISWLLKKYRGQIRGEIEIHYTFYIKNYSRTDCDNLVKPIQDILVKNGIIEDDRKIIYFSAEKIKSNIEKIEIEIYKI